ncbi:ABC transporter substrate-binding protein [Bosea sp. SSUT16]|jgi:peptide/nickel transport system substrate-binding protein|uniref:ABC transporter substrate-binding protein n=1 Tax=Bosea spartocytisi TaxID=2773451 RepID=A0A927EDN7_9HYPH|nr:ABC transporter substrate-binding protein [Bosea spartocytisi]MBD3848512.1 ABC transporter substrate-binding protein [Bosea spartocytisi]MCT4474909.1 ABC transporter substrate-binding protein [Bosea spartocytisi]
MTRLRAWLLAAALLAPAIPFLPTLSAAQGVPQSIPRKELLILENPEGTIKNAGWFNIWAINAGSQSNGLQQAALDTLWYIDPEKGLDGAWDNSLAAEKPVYNADFTEMRVKLRRGLFWSDGVEFTSADVKATVDIQIKNPNMRFSAVLANNVASVDTPDAETVIFKLKKSNSRFHTNFTVRWGAIWILPKHVFEKVEDPAKFDFNKPVSLGAYTLHSFDPDGKWYIWQLREDWQRSSLGRHGKPGPKYLAYIDPGPPDKRVIAQLNHELDVIHDIAPEGMFTLAKQDKGTRAWFKGFPYGHPDPTLPAVIFNTQHEQLKNRDVRWALALMIDVKAVTMAAYRGAATISAIAVPPTGIHPEAYHKPMEAWLKDFEIDTGKSKIKPYDPTVGKQIADMLRPSMGDQIPSDPAVIDKSFGLGWWKTNVAAAGELLTRAGFRKQGNQWLTPDGKPFVVRLMVEGDLRPVMTRAGTMIVQQWKQAGVDARIDVAQGTLLTRRAAGDFDAFIGWSVETWGGHQDLSYFMDSWHSQFVAPPGQPQPLRNWQRWSHPELDKIIEDIRKIDFDDPRGVELGRDYVKLMTREMPIIPLMAYNVFTAMDQTYWKGYPTADDPYANPVTNWGNSRYMFVRLKPAN